MGLVFRNLNIVLALGHYVGGVWCHKDYFYTEYDLSDCRRILRSDRSRGKIKFN